MLHHYLPKRLREYNNVSPQTKRHIFVLEDGGGGIVQQPLVIQKTEEELKVEHNNHLRKVHEEAGTQFKLIRQQLNNLLLIRSKPKSNQVKCM